MFLALSHALRMHMTRLTLQPSKAILSDLACGVVTTAHIIEQPPINHQTNRMQRSARIKLGCLHGFVLAVL